MVLYNNIPLNSYNNNHNNDNNNNRKQHFTTKSGRFHLLQPPNSKSVGKLPNGATSLATPRARFGDLEEFRRFRKSNELFET